MHDKTKRHKKHYRPTRDNWERSEADLTANNNLHCLVIPISDDAGKTRFFVVLFSTAIAQEIIRPDLPLQAHTAHREEFRADIVSSQRQERKNNNIIVLASVA